MPDLTAMQLAILQAVARGECQRAGLLEVGYPPAEVDRMLQERTYLRSGAGILSLTYEGIQVVLKQKGGRAWHGE